MLHHHPTQNRFKISDRHNIFTETRHQSSAEIRPASLRAPRRLEPFGKRKGASSPGAALPLFSCVEPSTCLTTLLVEGFWAEACKTV